MKANVTVCRTAYAHNTIEVEISDEELYKVNKNGKKVRLSRKKIDQLMQDKALDEAGGHSYSEHSSEYEVVGLNFVEVV